MVNNNQFSTLEEAWDRHRADVEALSRLSSSAIFVVERDGGYPFLSPNLESLGYDIPENGCSPDMNFLKCRIHPDDLPVFNDALTKLFDRVISLPQEERKDYKYIFEFRILGRSGEWVRIICQLQILDFNSLGNPIELGTLDISPDQTPDIGLRFTLMSIRTGEIVPFAIHDPAGGKLTPREIEILELIDAGLYSKEISERLSVSIHTVNRHRQNILEKTSTGNTHEAINYARRLGLLT